MRIDNTIVCLNCGEIYLDYLLYCPHCMFTGRICLKDLLLEGVLTEIHNRCRGRRMSERRLGDSH